MTCAVTLSPQVWRGLFVAVAFEMAIVLAITFVVKACSDNLPAPVHLVAQQSE